MTTPTPHGAPELDDQAFDVTSAWLRHSKTAATGGQLAAMCSFAKFILESRAAIQQAAGAVPEAQLLQKILACTHGDPMRKNPKHSGKWLTVMMRPELWEEITLAASPSPLGWEAGKEGSSDHLAACADGGVTQWRITKWGNCPVCHRDRIPSEACARNGCPDAPTSQINPGSAPREDGHE